MKISLFRKKIAKNHHNCLRYERALLSYFEYCQILLNILMDSLHLSNITNLENNSDPTTLPVSTDVYQLINFENVKSINRIF